MNLKIDKKTDVEGLLSRVENFASSLSADETTVAEITTIASEIAYNIIKYAPEGTLSLEYLENAKCVRIAASDCGPGFADVFEDAMKDGFSSSGSLGLGLPSLVRMCDELDVTTSSHGTKIICIKGI